MARKPSQAAQARAELIAALKRTNAKIKRTEARGVKLAGSQYDPRRTANTRNYTAAQARAYTAQLEEFNRRSLQFDAGHRGAPIPRGLISNARRAHRTLQRAKDAEFANVADIQLPSGQTIGERRAIVRQPRIPKLTPSSFRSVKDVLAYQAELERRLTPKHQQDVMDKRRGRMLSVIQSHGAEDLYNTVSDMTDEQLRAFIEMGGMDDLEAAAWDSDPIIAKGTPFQPRKAKDQDTAFTLGHQRELGALLTAGEKAQSAKAAVRRRH